ncbi:MULTISPECIES: sigma-70 family RNA polymerase sigma factor [Streptomyces]|uniref:sigma-70 family RNA polymerase sigma factor n=1 Tax=Streptomyces TaxID=1883 RepID=UPI000998611A|nr:MULTISPECIES: sigma-70 family RNA polymerase sigma factor [Streptomyces]AQW48156.1 RNA polymerase sigma factor [Streptomyces hygroscopicus]ASQ98570.1 B/F/G family RNA polymerase sigma-70 factor [Streptomyces sp. 11-1-2]MBO3677901.1 sigma-70 family RNA polymerase sigma factor [Streptomyces sp. NEAU-YJ-81]
MSATATRQRRHDDTPDTGGAFLRLSRLPSGSERDALREAIICAWLPVAKRLALRFRNKGENIEDLTQVASLALVKAVDRYNPDLGHAFPSYAIPVITGELKRHFRDYLWTLHIPRNIQEVRSRTRSARDALEQELGGRTPTIHEICLRTGMPQEDVKAGLEASASCTPLSLNATVQGAEERLLAETVGADDAAIERVVNREALRVLIAELSEQDRYVLYLRFFAGLSQSQIGEILGFSQMHISRRLSRLYSELRQGLMAYA